MRESPPQVGGGLEHVGAMPGGKAVATDWVTAGRAAVRRGLRRHAREGIQAALETAGLGDRLYWRLPAGSDGVALTFDDGPDPEGTPRILDVLADRKVRATFFLIGERARRFPDLTRRIVAEGHAIGNHTFSHVRCDRLSFTALERELLLADQAIAEAYPQACAAGFRPPFGAVTSPLMLHLLRSGRSVAMWSRDSHDYRGASAGEIAALSATIRRRDIVLLHDRFTATIEALPRLIDTLSDRGLAPVPLRTSDPAPQPLAPLPLPLKLVCSWWRFAGSGE